MRRIKLLLFILLGLFILVSTKEVEASEGRFNLTGQVSCEGISVWSQSRYQVLGRCDGLEYPYTEQVDEYVLWLTPEDGTPNRRIDNVDSGIFSGNTDKKISRIFITAETNSSPKTPSAYIVAEGRISGFNFDEPDTTITSPQPTSRPILSTPSPTPRPGLSLGAGIARGALILFAVVVIVLGIILFRSR